MLRRQRKRTANNHITVVIITSVHSSKVNSESAKILRKAGVAETMKNAIVKPTAKIVGFQSPLKTSPPVHHGVGGSTKTTNSRSSNACWPS